MLPVSEMLWFQSTDLNFYRLYCLVMHVCGFAQRKAINFCHVILCF